MATTQMPPGFNPYQYMMQEDPDVAALKAAHAKAIADQQASLAAQKGYLGAESEFTPQTNLAPLLGLIDQWSGSKLAHSYQAPESGDQRLAKVAALEAGIRGQQNTLNADNLAQLKSAITEKKSDKNTLLRYMENQDKIQSNENLRDLIIKSNERIQKDKGQNVLDNTDSKNNGAVVIQKLKNEGRVAGKAAGKTLPATQGSKLADMAAAYSHFDDNHKMWLEDIASNPLSGPQSLIKNTKANKYEGAGGPRERMGNTYSASQFGFRNTKDLIKKHTDQVEGAWDSLENGNRKYIENKKFMRSKYNEELKKYAELGYDVSQVKKLPADLGTPYGEDAIPSAGVKTREEKIKEMQALDGQ